MAPARGSRTNIRSTPTAPAPPRGIWWRAALIVVAGLLAYSNSLSGPFILDDQVSIVENSPIRDLSRLGEVLAPERELPTAGRPLVNLSFALNYAAGGVRVLGYHVVNLALHLACGLLIFGIVRRTLALPRMGDRWSGRSADLALAAALLWTVHPLNTDAVDYVTQRTELMMALCYLAAIYASIRAWRPAGAGRPGWLALSIASCAAGMACKESMVTAPPMLLAYDGIFLFDSLTEALRKRWRFYAGLALSWGLLAFLISNGPRMRSAGFSAGVSPWTYLLDQTTVITRYLRLAVWPRSLVIEYGWPFPATLAGVLPDALLLCALLALTVVAVVRWPRFGFLGVWFFVTLAPASSIVPIATEVGAERRMYLPLIAIVVLAVIGASFVTRVGKAGAATALALAAALLAAGTWGRNREFESPLVLAETAVERYPTPVGHHLLGTQLMAAGRDDEAIAELRRALPAAPRAHYSLATVLLKQGKLAGAIDEAQAFLRAQPLVLEAVDARQMLGHMFAREQRWPEAIEQYRLVLSMNPSRAQRLAAIDGIGEALYALKRFDEAAASYAQYLQAVPNDGHALRLEGLSLAATGRLDEGIAMLRRASQVEPENGDTRLNLADALFSRRDADGAAVEAARAIALKPDDADAHELFGRILAVQGKLGDAATEFERVLRLDPANADAKADLVKLRTLEAQPPSARGRR
jgi:protein O-mannosyl-transferase